MDYSPSLISSSTPFIQYRYSRSQSSSRHPRSGFWGGFKPTVTTRAWHIEARLGTTTNLKSYQSEHITAHPDVNAVTKIKFQNGQQPILVRFYRGTLIEDPDEEESLMVPFDMMRHGTHVDSIPIQYGGRGAIRVDDTWIPMCFDGEKMYLVIEHPTEQELDELPIYDLNSSKPMERHLDEEHEAPSRRRQHRTKPEGEIPLSEWRKRLALLPEDVVKKTLENTTQYYQELEHENRGHPRRHLKALYHAL